MGAEEIALLAEASVNSLHDTPPRTVKVRARGEDFRIVELMGNILVCSKAHGNCCCGWTEKGRAPVNQALYEQEWERRRIRNKVHLSFTARRERHGSEQLDSSGYRCRPSSVVKKHAMAPTVNGITSAVATQRRLWRQRF